MLISRFFFIAVLIAVTPHSLVDAQETAQKLPHKSNEQKIESFDAIEKLINDLGAKDFLVRENASKLLAQMPHALAVLRSYVMDKELERQRRVKVLVETLGPRNFKKLLADLIERKDQVPIDLLAEVIAYHGQHLSNDDAKAVLATVEATKARILKESKDRPSLLPFNMDLFAEPRPLLDLKSDEVKIGGSARWGKVVGNDLDAPRLFLCAVFASGTLRCSGCYGSLIATGDMIRSDSVEKSIVMTNGSILLQSQHSILGSAVFVDGDIDSFGASNSILVATGSIKIRSKAKNCELIDNARRSSRITFFSLGTLGLEADKHEKGFLITAVKSHSLAAQAGLLRGDVLVGSSKDERSLSNYEKKIRQGLAKNSGVVVEVLREGAAIHAVLSFSK
jgi:hypothetical protein